MDIHEAKKLIDQKTVTVVDIRDPETFQQGRIQGAVFLNNANLEDFLKNVNKQIPLLCYCYHGITSQGAVEYFRNHGFAQVYSLDGGFEAWSTQYPVING